MAEILANWGIFNAANAPHLEMYAVNWALYEQYRKKAWEFERKRDPNEQKVAKNQYLGYMNTYERKVQKNLADMGVGTMGLAKIGQAIAKTKKEGGMEDLLD